MSANLLTLPLFLRLLVATLAEDKTSASEYVTPATDLILLALAPAGRHKKFEA
jgi:hypothetical protein